VIQFNQIEKETRFHFEEWRKNMEITEIIKNRVKLNEKLFSEEETKMILDNVEVFSRIYLLGLLDKK
jgi:hypothetical protein